MLQNTFLHIPYVGELIEQKLWENKIFSWDDFLDSKINLPNRELIEKFIRISKEKYTHKDYEFFSRRLMYKYHWRAYNDFRNNVCFLDIETTGLDKHRDDITLIGLYSGKDYKFYVNGKNMQEFEKDISRYAFIVSYNGFCFDLPFIKSKFPKLDFTQFHVDLRFGLRKLGFYGGLKKIERDFGIKRKNDLDTLTGLDAVKLWYVYKTKNDESALQKLIDYNCADVQNLKILMEFYYETMLKRFLTNCSSLL